MLICLLYSLLIDVAGVISRRLLIDKSCSVYCCTVLSALRVLCRSALGWYLCSQSLYFCFVLERERERNVLFNDALNTFYLRLYGVINMVKDRSDSEKGNPLPPHRLLLSINSKGSFLCPIPQTG